MTTLETSRDHRGPVRYSKPNVRFDTAGYATVRHERAKELVAEHDEVSYAFPIPTEYDELREIAAALPTETVDGNDTADTIVSFLERFRMADIRTLCDDPSRLEVSRERGRERYDVLDPKPEDAGMEPEYDGTPGE